MKITEVRSTLTGKLKLKICEKARHSDFRYVSDAGVVPLPLLVRLSRGAGEIANGNVSGLARSLGLTEAEFKLTVSCSIDRPCVLLCLVSTMVHFAARHKEQNGSLVMPGVRAMIESANIILEGLAGGVVPAWRADELHALQRVEAGLERFRYDADFGPVSTRLRGALSLARSGEHG